MRVFFPDFNGEEICILLRTVETYSILFFNLTYLANYVHKSSLISLYRHPMPNLHRHSRILGAADEAVLSKVHKKSILWFQSPSWIPWFHIVQVVQVSMLKLFKTILVSHVLVPRFWILCTGFLVLISILWFDSPVFHAIVS